MSDYVIGRARYAKNSVAIHCPSSDGLKTRAARLCEALKGRYSNREKAYIMSEAKGEKFKEMYERGCDGKRKFDYFHANGFSFSYDIFCPEKSG